MKSLRNCRPYSQQRRFARSVFFAALSILGFCLVSLSGQSIALAAKKQATAQELVEKSPLKQALLKAKHGRDHKKITKHSSRKHSKKIVVKTAKKSDAKPTAKPELRAKVAGTAPIAKKLSTRKRAAIPSSHYETKTEWLYDSTAATDKDCGQALIQAQSDLKSLYEDQCNSLKEKRGCVGCTTIEFGRTTKEQTTDNQCEVRLSAQWQAEDCISVD